MPDPLVVGNVYSVAKRAAEHLCTLYAREHGIEIVIARCFAFVGEDLPLGVHFAIGNFIRDALWGDEIVVKGDGTPLRSYLDQRDLAKWLTVLLFEGKAGEAYNVGSDHAISIADLAHLVRDLVSPGKRIRILGQPVNDAERDRYIPDISKIHHQLGLWPSISLEQSILDAAAAARARGSESCLAGGAG
jgi:dTDP-glucose 4,6-dehydratase